jgi:hypothetical protein
MSSELYTIILSSIIPLATLIYTVIGLKHKAEIDYVARVEKRLEEEIAHSDDLEKRLKECEDTRVELVRRVRKLEELEEALEARLKSKGRR